MGKPILVLDFDGVLHSYTSKWTSADEVLDGPVPGAMEALFDYAERFEVHVFSSRSASFEGRIAMRDALARWISEGGPGVSVTWPGIGSNVVALTLGTAHDVVRFPTEKPPAFLTIDDRAYCFEGRFPAIDEILAFKPWNKRPVGHLPATEALQTLAAARHHVNAIYQCTDPEQVRQHAMWAIEALKVVATLDPED